MNNSMPSTVVLLLALTTAHAALSDEPPQPPGRVAPPAGTGDQGLSLDQAIERLERENLTLTAMWLEVPQARADIVTAGQRPDAFRLIGGGADGPVRLRPLDLGPKRWARVLAARLAARVIEAQYRDAVRNQTANLYTAYVDVQEAQGQAQFARIYLEGIDRMVAAATKHVVEPGQGLIDLARLTMEQDSAAASASAAEDAFRKVKLTLADLLNIPDAEAGPLEDNANTEQGEPSLPALGELTRLGLRQRPDVGAYRLGLRCAQAEWLRAWVEQWPDLYIFTPPNRPGRPGAPGGADALLRTWELWVRLPDADHYQGKLARARANVAQAQIELARAKRQVVLDVRQAHLEYESSLAARRRLRDLVSDSVRVRNDAYRLFQGGARGLSDYLSCQSMYNQAAHQYFQARIRVRRGALALNTAVGKRLLP